MAQISHRRQNPNLFSSLSSLPVSNSYRSSVKLTPLIIESTHRRPNIYPSSTIIVDSNEFQKLKQILEWRMSTDFPIVKIRSYKLSQEKQTINCKLVEVIVELQSKYKSLTQMNKLPFFQAIYVLKESLIGFERLCHHFGFFTPTIEMIKFNENQNCKVWINEDCFSNVTNLGSVKSQKQFVFEICSIVENQTIKSKASVLFFEKMKTCKYFFEAICLIDDYVKSKKIIIPTRIQNLQESKSPLLLKTSLNSKINFDKKKKNLIKSAKVPQFIKKNNVKKTISSETNTPILRKMTVCKGQIYRDYSLTNISRNNSTNSLVKNDLSQKNVKNNGQDPIDQDTFLQDMNIRLLEPMDNHKNNHIPSTPNFYQSFYEQTLQSPNSPNSTYGQISQIFYNKQKKTRYSIINRPNQQEISPFEIAQNLFLTSHKPNCFDETYSASPQKKSPLTPRCIKTLQYLDDQQSFDSKEQNQISQEKFQPLSISEIRDKRKLSEDFLTTKSNLKGIKLSSIGQQKTQNFLNVPGFNSILENLRKSPSHQLISSPQKRRNNQEEEEIQNAEKQYLRDTIMNKNGWTGFGLFANLQSVKQSFVDGQQIPRVEAKTSDLLKLGGMGRIVRCSMIEETEFQLEFGSRMQKENEVRNEFMNILE